MGQLGFGDQGCEETEPDIMLFFTSSAPNNHGYMLSHSISECSS